MLAGNMTWDLECQASALVTRLSLVPKEKNIFSKETKKKTAGLRVYALEASVVWRKVKRKCRKLFLPQDLCFPEVVCQSIDLL